MMDACPSETVSLFSHKRPFIHGILSQQQKGINTEVGIREYVVSVKNLSMWGLFVRNVEDLGTFN